MVDLDFARVLVQRCIECSGLGRCRFHHRCWPYLVRHLLRVLSLRPILMQTLRREAFYCLILGYCCDVVPMVLNGAIGADLHINFAVASRSSFGFFFSRFAVVVRMITALFWHGKSYPVTMLDMSNVSIAIQTYTGSTALTQIIRAIWPSYLNIPNHLPASAGVTSQQLLSHFLFWSIQFPFLLIPPHKLRWFFVFKSVLVTIVATATVIAVCVQAGGAGNIWDQQATVTGSKKSWLILSSMSSITGGW